MKVGIFGGWSLARTADVAIGDSDVRASARCAAAATLTSGDAAETLHNPPIAVGAALDTRAMAEGEVGRLACQR